MDLQLRGRRAIVTGGSKGLGYAISRELAREGARVALCSRRGPDAVEAAQRLAIETGAEVHGFGCDVTHHAQAERFVLDALEALGGLDILVNNAGGARPGTFATLAESDYREDLEIKLFAAMRMCRLCFDPLKASDQPRVVNINAVAGRQSIPGLFATVTDRGSALAFNKALSDEWAPFGILVNSVNIGNVLTPQWENIAKRLGPGKTGAEVIEERSRREVPLGRAGRPDEVAGMVAFLCSARASYMTGDSIDVAGGLGRYV